MTGTAFVRSTALSRTVDGEVLLTAPGREGVDLLSATAGAVWSLLEEPRTATWLVDEVCRRFEVPRERIEAGVGQLLADLAERGWIREVDVGG
jgi:Coenzyme PQQ synthesis protein D (PqqD)